MQQEQQPPIQGKQARWARQGHGEETAVHTVTAVSAAEAEAEKAVEMTVATAATGVVPMAAVTRAGQERAVAWAVRVLRAAAAASEGAARAL